MTDTLSFGNSQGLGSDYPIAIFFPGTFNSNQEVTVINVLRAFRLRANCQGSIARLDVGTTGTVVFKIKKNGVQVGTFTFAPSATNATFSMTDDTLFLSGDVLSIHAPTSADASAAFLSLGLLGFKL